MADYTGDRQGGDLLAPPGSAGRLLLQGGAGLAKSLTAGEQGDLEREQGISVNRSGTELQTGVQGKPERLAPVIGTP